MLENATGAEIDQERLLIPHERVNVARVPIPKDAWRDLQQLVGASKRRRRKEPAQQQKR
jgi:hypothetical protein